MLTSTFKFIKSLNVEQLNIFKLLNTIKFSFDPMVKTFNDFPTFQIEFEHENHKNNGV